MEATRSALFFAYLLGLLVAAEVGSQDIDGDEFYTVAFLSPNPEYCIVFEECEDSLYSIEGRIAKVLNFEHAQLQLTDTIPTGAAYPGWTIGGEGLCHHRAGFKDSLKRELVYQSFAAPDTSIVLRACDSDDSSHSYLLEMVTFSLDPTDSLLAYDTEDMQTVIRRLAPTGDSIIAVLKGHYPWFSRSGHKVFTIGITDCDNDSCRSTTIFEHDVRRANSRPATTLPGYLECPQQLNDSGPLFFLWTRSDGTRDVWQWSESTGEPVRITNTGPEYRVSTYLVFEGGMYYMVESSANPLAPDHHRTIRGHW